MEHQKQYVRKKKNVEFLHVICYQLKINCNNFKIFYASIMATTKKKTYSKHTKDKKKEINTFTKKKNHHQITEEDGKNIKGIKEIQNNQKAI